jgi:hypothetical protein
MGDEVSEHVASVGGVTDADAEVVATDITPTAARAPASAATRLVVCALDIWRLLLLRP